MLSHFESIVPLTCCLCGANGQLTGEHKLKAAALREEFGDMPPVIGPYDGTAKYLSLSKV